MDNHDVREWTPFVDSDTARTFAIGMCVSCRQPVRMVCSCGRTFYVRAMALVCNNCDWLSDDEAFI